MAKKKARYTLTVELKTDEPVMNRAIRSSLNSDVEIYDIGTGILTAGKMRIVSIDDAEATT